MTSVPAIVVSDLSRRFGETLAVSRVSFAVDEGALFGIVGADGAGKTTTLRMLAGVLRPSTGDATIYGGSGQGNLGGIEAAPFGAHGRSHSLALTLPPLATIYLRPHPNPNHDALESKGAR